MTSLTTGYYWASPASDPTHRVLVRVGYTFFGVPCVWETGRAWSRKPDEFIGYVGPIRPEPAPEESHA